MNHRYCLSSLTLLSVIGCFEAKLTAERALPSDAGSAVTRDAGATEAPRADGSLEWPVGRPPNIPPRHQSCRSESLMSRQSSTPSLWQFGVSPEETVNNFSRFECNDVATWPRCDASHPCPSHKDANDEDVSPICLFLEPGTMGYCPGQAQDTVMSFRNGQCASWSSSDLKSLACCSGFEGVDCRSYPFTKLGKVGELCERTADCEPGLECVIADEEWPRCLCPGIDALIGGQALGCTVQPHYPPWGAAPSHEPIGCYETETPEYYRQVFQGRLPGDDRWGPRPALEPLIARLSADGKVALFYAGVESLRAISAPDLLINIPVPAPVGTLVDFDLPMGAPRRHRVEFAPDGSLAILWHDDVRGSLYRYRAGSWSQSDVPGSGGAGDIAFDSRGVAHLLLRTNPGWTYAVENGAWWDLTEVLPQGPAYWTYIHLAISSTNEVRAILSDCGTLGGSLLTLSNQVSSPIGATCDSVQLADDTIAAAGIDFREGKMDVVLRRIAGDGSVENELVWQMPSDVRVEHPRPRLALSKSGEIVIGHRTPDGMSVSRKVLNQWVTTRVASFAGNPVPIFDENDELVVFYTLEIAAPMKGPEIGDFVEGQPEQLGVIRKWDCRNEPI